MGRLAVLDTGIWRVIHWPDPRKTQFEWAVASWRVAQSRGDRAPRHKQARSALCKAEQKIAAFEKAYTESDVGIVEGCDLLFSTVFQLLLVISPPESCSKNSGIG